jgi:dipeptidyl aminopeptidase/acylaminoacyl peptidase
LLCFCALGGLVSFSAAASGAGDQPQIAVFSQDGNCSGFILETLTGEVTECRAGTEGGWFAVGADGSIVNDGGNNMGPVTLIRPDGEVTVVDSNPNDFDPSLSPDGSKVVFARYEPQNYQGAWPSNLFVVDTDGSGLKGIASGGDSQLSVPTFSPDGSTIAYSCEPTFAIGAAGVSEGCGPLPDGSTREFATLLVNADGSDKRVILLNQATQSLSWSADGKWIATESVAPCACSDGEPASTQIFVYHTDGSDLFNGGDPSQNVNPDPSREVTRVLDQSVSGLAQFLAGSSSRLVYYSDADCAGDFGCTYMINIDGTNRHELSLSDEGAQNGQIIPASTGGGPPPFVNMMRVPVPSVRSLSYRAAKQKLQGAHLRVGKTRRQYSSRTPRNHILGQYPHGGGYAHRTTRQSPRVTLTLSRGPRK